MLVNPYLPMHIHAHYYRRFRVVITVRRSYYQNHAAFIDQSFKLNPFLLSGPAWHAKRPRSVLRLHWERMFGRRHALESGRGKCRTMEDEQLYICVYIYMYPALSEDTHRRVVVRRDETRATLLRRLVNAGLASSLGD